MPYTVSSLPVSWLLSAHENSTVELGWLQCSFALLCGGFTKCVQCADGCIAFQRLPGTSVPMKSKRQHQTRSSASNLQGTAPDPGTSAPVHPASSSNRSDRVPVVMEPTRQRQTRSSSSNLLGTAPVPGMSTPIVVNHCFFSVLLIIDVICYTRKWYGDGVMTSLRTIPLTPVSSNQPSMIDTMCDRCSLAGLFTTVLILE